MIRAIVNRAAQILVLPLILSLGAVGPVHAQGFSIMGGLNFSNQDDINTGSASATFENSTGYHVGLSYELGLGIVSLRPGVVYQRLGTFDFATATENVELDLSAVEVPVDLRLTVLPTPALSPYLVAGPVFTFPQGEGELSDAVETLSMTADLGAGIEIGLPGSDLRLLPEVRYSFGITDYLSESFDIGGTTIQPAEEALGAGKFMIRLHIGF
ncbi:MAG: outer membrane beta-barrel protein [Longimicrobiales bacterium]|nr:outer membrane beta-barrel protein [Longimicrobiales bacterium]